ncbi:glucosaminidase domain-containing protein [Aliidiomarina sp. Khilg15.8]
MSILLRLLAAVIVIAGLAVPFVLYDTSSEDDSSSRSATVRTGLPLIGAPLSTRTRSIPDFADIDNVGERKRIFFSFLIPAIEEENSRILAQREHLKRLQEKVESGLALSRAEQNWLDEMLTYYRVDATDTNEQFSTLLRRADIVPQTLVLVQAANESGWGTSRFARDARNFFGQWCWTEGCGIVPGARGAGQSHEVRRFDSMEASVKSFIRNLNTHFAYVDLRGIRAEMRDDNEAIAATALTQGLLSYSERGEEYILELNQMIRVNRPIIEEVRDATES